MMQVTPARHLPVGLLITAFLYLGCPQSQAQDASADPWQLATAGSALSGQTVVGENAPNDLYTNNGRWGKSDRSRAAILDSVELGIPDSRDTSNPVVIGLEARQRLALNAVGSVNDTLYSRNAAGVFGDAVREGPGFQTVSGYVTGVLGRASTISDSYDDVNREEAKNHASKVAGVGGAAGHFDPKYDEPTIQDGSNLKTGYAKQMLGGEFNVLADNLYFDDSTNPGGKFNDRYSCDHAYGVLSKIVTGYFQNAPNGKKYGAHILEGKSIYAGTYLQGEWDKIDKSYGVFVEAPFKETKSNTISAQNAEALAALPESYGVYINTPFVGNGTPGQFVTPTNYVGLKVKAKAEFDEESHFNDHVYVNSANLTIANGTLFADGLVANGQGITELNAAELTGTVADARLSAAAQDAIAKRHAQNTDTGTNSNNYELNNDSSAGPVTLNFNDSGSNGMIQFDFSSGFYFHSFDSGMQIDGEVRAHGVSSTNGYLGDGGQLTNLNASNLGSGTVPVTRLPADVRNKREMQYLANFNATTKTNVGFGATFTDKTAGTLAASLESDASYISYPTTTTSGNASGWTSNAVARRDYAPEFVVRLRTDGTAITNSRYWIGLTSADLAAVGAPTTQHIAAFRYDSALDATARWRSVTANGSSSTVTDLGATNGTIAANTAYTLRIVLGSSNVEFYINDVLVRTETATLPSGSTNLNAQMTLTVTSAGTAKTLKFSRLAMLMN